MTTTTENTVSRETQSWGQLDLKGKFNRTALCVGAASVAESLAFTGGSAGLLAASAITAKSSLAGYGLTSLFAASASLVSGCLSKVAYTLSADEEQHQEIENNRDPDSYLMTTNNLLTVRLLT